MTRHTARNAFTLVELAIVIVIIGLIVGAVMSGTSLLKQSELQGVTNDYAKYTSAVNTFRQQYGGWPGDLLDATSFWGDSSACPDAAIVDGTPGTCIGDNDGKITGTSEPFRAWQQLLLAKLIKGSFSGTATSGVAEPGTNVPKSTIKNAGWSIENNTSSAGVGHWFTQDIGNYVAIGGTVSGGITQGPILTPDDASQVDKKLDDGSPAYGRIVAFKSTSTVTPLCTTTAVDTTAAYALSTKGRLCSLNMSLTLK